MYCKRACDSPILHIAKLTANMNMLKRVLILTAALLLPSVGLLAQVSVGGTVVDAGGKALPGATVSVEGTSTGAVTAADGSFSLKVQRYPMLSSLSQHQAR